MPCKIRDPNNPLYATVEVPGASAGARRDALETLERIGAQDIVADPDAATVTARIRCGRRSREAFVCGGTAFEGAGFIQPTRCGSCFIRNR